MAPKLEVVTLEITSPLQIALLTLALFFASAAWSARRRLQLRELLMRFAACAVLFLLGGLLGGWGGAALALIAAFVGIPSLSIVLLARSGSPVFNTALPLALLSRPAQDSLLIIWALARSAHGRDIQGHQPSSQFTQAQSTQAQSTQAQSTQERERQQKLDFLAAVSNGEQERVIQLNEELPPWTGEFATVRTLAIMRALDLMDTSHTHLLERAATGESREEQLKLVASTLQGQDALGAQLVFAARAGKVEEVRTLLTRIGISATNWAWSYWLGRTLLEQEQRSWQIQMTQGTRDPRESDGVRFLVTAMERGPARWARKDIEARLGGLGLAIQMPERSASAVRGSPFTPATFGLLAIVAFVFVLELITEARSTGIRTDFSINTLVQLGGNARSLSFAGNESWRLLTATLLHGGIAHILVNSLAFFSIGRTLERFSGSGTVLGLYALTGIIASLTTAIFGSDQILSVGASGALFGLYGYLACTAETLPTRFQRLRSNLANLAFAFGVTLFLPGVDYFAHAGGLLSGLALGLAFAPWGRTTQLIAGALGALAIAGATLQILVRTIAS